jgi:hypothetical protein
MHRAGADFVDRSDVPAEMMMARRLRARECDHVMIAAVDAMQERDVIPGMVGQAQAQNARVELYRFSDIAGEHQDMGEPPGPRARHLAAERSAALAGRTRLKEEMTLFIRRRFRGNLDLHQNAVVIAEP